MNFTISGDKKRETTKNSCFPYYDSFTYLNCLSISEILLRVSEIRFSFSSMTLIVLVIKSPATINAASLFLISLLVLIQKQITVTDTEENTSPTA